jgi:hypothetical protein
MTDEPLSPAAPTVRGAEGAVHPLAKRAHQRVAEGARHRLAHKGAPARQGVFRVKGAGAAMRPAAAIPALARSRPAQSRIPAIQRISQLRAATHPPAE